MVIPVNDAEDSEESEVGSRGVPCGLFIVTRFSFEQKAFGDKRKCMDGVIQHIETGSE